MRFVTAAILSTLAISGAAISAQAATCQSGYACFFADLSYTGTRWTKAANSGNLRGSAANNQATSIAANGGQCYATRFYDSGDLGGSYLILWSEQIKGSNYRDPDLRNGAGVGPAAYRTMNYDDRISGWKFTGC